MRLEFKRIIPMIVQNIMFVGEVFQIEVSDGLVHPLGSRQNVNLYPAVVIIGAQVSGVCMCVEFKRIKMIVKNIMLVGEVFQIKFQMVLSIPLGVVKM